jgi:hypothetical protein
MTSVRNRLVGRVLAGMAFAAVACLAVPAHAQFGEAAGIAESMQPDYFKRDVTIIAQEMKLDDTQRVIVDALFGDYETAFQAGVERTKGRIEGMRDQIQTDDVQRVLRMVLATFKEWGPEKERIGDEFLENVKVVLTNDQLEHWPTVTRRLYRDKHIYKGQLSGESLNLFDVVRELHLDDRTGMQVQPIMEAYDIALDQALHRRDCDTSVKANALEYISESDAQKGFDAMKRQVELRVGVRNVNDEFIERVADVMPADIASEFRQSALDRAYPRIYRETPVERLFKDAKKIEGLDSGVLQSINQVESAFLNELAPINIHLRDVLREYEPEDAVARAEQFNKRMNGQDVQPKIDPTRELFTSRDELGRTYAKQLQQLLTPEQFAQLPGAQRWVEPPQDATRATPAVVSPPSKTRKPDAKMRDQESPRSLTSDGDR